MPSYCLMNIGYIHIQGGQHSIVHKLCNMYFHRHGAVDMEERQYFFEDVSGPPDRVLLNT